jgi:DHA2 family multidrug resistance protein
MVFVPLTTATMDAISREEMGNATSIFNLMRNLGGSCGIAAATTYLFRREQIHTLQLGAHVTAAIPRTERYLHGVESALMARGSDPLTAAHQAQGAIWGMVLRQASMISFVDTFRAMGIVFLLVIPLLLVMKRPKSSGRGAGMH